MGMDSGGTVYGSMGGNMGGWCSAYTGALEDASPPEAELVESYAAAVAPGCA